MEIINQARVFAPIGIEPLKRIELIGKVCTKKEDNITNDTAEKFFVRRIHDGHCAIAEHGVEYYKITCHTKQLKDKFIDALKTLKYVDYINEDNNIYIAINYRVMIDMLIILDTYSTEYIKKYDILYAAILIGDIVKFNSIDYMLFKNSLDDKLNELDIISMDITSFDKYSIEMLTEEYIIRHYTAIWNISVKFITDRGVSHEFVRHTTLSFMQESTRWCKYDKGIVFIRPYWMSDEEYDKFNSLNRIEGEHNFTKIHKNDLSTFSDCSRAFIKHCLATERNYATLICGTGQAQAARAVLGQSVKTEIWITGAYYKFKGINYSNINNCPIKEKKGLIPQRTAKEAHPDMQIAMKDLGKDIEMFVYDIQTEYQGDCQG